MAVIEMLNQIDGFDGCFPFFTHFEGHDGMIGFMQIDDHTDALIGSEFEFLQKKHGKAARLSSQVGGVFERCKSS